MHPAQQPADAAIHASLTTKEGWRRFVDDVPAPPALLGRSQREQLDPVERAGYQEHRLSYHARLIIVATPMIRQVVATGRRLVLLNRHQLSARRGLIVTGPAATGKTTAITQLGKHHELTVRRRDPTAHARLPVVYVTVPPAATPRMLAGEFARFLGLPLTRRQTRPRSPTRSATCSASCTSTWSWWTNSTTSRSQPVLAPKPPTSSNTCRSGSRRRSSWPGSTWSASGCSAAPAAARSPAASPPSPPAPSPTAPNPNASSGAPWSPRWRRPCGCTTTGPAACSGSTATSTSAPAA